MFATVTSPVLYCVYAVEPIFEVKIITWGTASIIPESRSPLPGLSTLATDLKDTLTARSGQLFS